MTEVIQTRSRRMVRRRLLLTVSSAALVALSPSANADENSGRPTVWIELGGAFDQIAHGSESWVPPNLTAPISNPSPKPFGTAPNIGYDFDAAITIQPEDSEWIYTASVRYGRAQKGPRRTHDQAYDLELCNFNQKYCLSTYAFLNAKEKTSSTHAIIDFSAGKDIGLGSFHHGKSTIHYGVRVAQLTEHADAMLTAFSTQPQKYSPGKLIHEADALFVRSFTGVGPSVSWDGATPLIGSLNDGVTFDWGANAAILFGRQKANLNLHTNDTRYYKYGAHTVLSDSTVAPNCNRIVAVPNLGAFAGFSWRLPNGKVSFGYRGDFFFGAIDGGIAAAQRNTNGFYGPFASVSIGLGG